MTSFKTKYAFQKRKNEADRILQKYPQRIPIICEKDPRSRDTPDIDRKKYLVPPDLSVAQFMYVIRGRINIMPDLSIYLFVNNTVMPATAQLLSVLYEEHKDRDGFLYITYAGESSFGGNWRNF
jgi:GABA(A) receptor-associated protein